MGQHTKSTRPGLPHTGRPHGRVPLATLTTALSNLTRACPVEPKFSPIQNRPILRALRHSKAYKYILKEKKRGDTEEEVRNFLRKAN
ncbi:hypothetical protein F383_32323 [Gossypium arboreum]|uniref:Uncharacterized protein n=1 Tax=Gossypium arboreum TaxID=29729 RepID=A0A0B0N0C7_GOSAR|nr:hypothetical protein F383_32323 [Gossypium arboreum]